MIVTPQTMAALFQAYNFEFQQAFVKAPSHAFEVAMKTTSKSSSEMYPWLGQFPQMREWVGDRVLNSLAAHEFTIKNLKFESTVNVKREMIEDDQYGLLKPMLGNMGRMTRLHPDKLVFGLLKDGFNTKCYDGQNFFDAEHPKFVNGDSVGADSNVMLPPEGVDPGPAWFLLDTTQGVKPIVFQERIPYEFQNLVSSNNEFTFIRDQYLFGVRARVNAGFGLWQLAFGSTAPLTHDNYAHARATMQALRGDQGDLLGVVPNLLVVPPALERDARMILKATTVSSADFATGRPSDEIAANAVSFSNVWHESAELLVTPFLG